MSDDEDVVYVKRQNTVHYGSLEEQERKRLAANKDVDDDQGKYANVHTSNGEFHTWQVTSEMVWLDRDVEL